MKRVSLTLRIFLPFALGYLLSSIFRSINGVIAPDLVADLGLSASELGFAVGAFFLSATLFQLPYGILLDRYDPRRVYASVLGLCALGAVVTSFAFDVATLTFGRALIALGTSASAVTSYRVYAMWFPAERLALANGLSLAAGGLGLLVGTVPVEFALGYLDWRGVHLIIAAAIAVGAVLVLTVAPGKTVEGRGGTLRQQILGLGIVLKSPEFWRVAPMMCMVLGTFGAFSALWTGVWVRDVAGFDDAAAANLLLLLAGAMTLSGLVTGPAAALANRIGLGVMGFAVATAILLVVLMIAPFLQWVPSTAGVMAIWAALGFLAPLNMVIYAALGPRFPPQLVGRLNACLTLSWMLGGFVVQNLYGIVLDQFPSQGSHYALEGHRLGIGLLIALTAAAVAWYFVSGWVFPTARPTDA